MRTKMIIRTIVGCVFLAFPAWAAPVERANIPDSSKWVAHFDVEALTASRIGLGTMELIRDNASAVTQEKVQKAEKIWDILADVKSLTFYGRTLDKMDVVVVAKLDYDKADIMKLLGIHSYGEHEIYATGPKGQECSSRGKAHFVCLYDKNTIVATRNQDRLKEALDLLDGRGKTLRTNRPLSKMIDSKPGSFMVVAVQNVNEMVAARQDKEANKNMGGRAALLKKCQDLRLEVGESDAAVFAGLDITLKSTEDAANVQQAAQGMLALAMLNAGEDETMLKTLQSIKIDLQENNLAIQVQSPVKDILSKMQDKLK